MNFFDATYSYFLVSSLSQAEQRLQEEARLKSEREKVCFSFLFV
jgi:hypothetical protein